MVSAWPPELARLRAALAGAHAAPAVALASIGVGLVDASVGASRLLETLRPEAAILVGTAGLYPGTGREHVLGAAVVADDLVMLPEILPGRHAYLPDLVVTRQRPTLALSQAIRKAGGLRAASVANPLAITRSEQAARYAARHSACVLENLEAFAFARAAASLGIPFAVVLGIANHVGPSAHREWRKNAGPAAAAACEAVVAFLARAMPSRR